MKDFNTYEKLLIKLHENPKICIMTDGADWLYLNELQMKHNASITIIGSNPLLLEELDKIKDYDIMLFESGRSFSDADLSIFTKTALILSSEYKKKISLIYSFIKSDKKGIKQFICNDGLINLLGSSEGLFDTRSLLDIATKNLYYENSKKRSKKKK